jgi:hypothetical protein
MSRTRPDKPRSRAVPQRFEEAVAPAVGLTISHTWQGHGSAIFLELGKLHRKVGRHHPQGQFSIMLPWSWRVESPRRVEFGSWSSDRKIASGVASLTGQTVEAISVAGRLPELVLAFSGQRWVHSFMTAEGQPGWTVFLPDGDWYCVKRGILTHEQHR